MKRTTMHTCLKLGLLTLALTGAPGILSAHEGEVHDDAAKAAAPRTLLPRATVATDEVELVAVLEPGHLLVWVDRFASNEPVRGAQLEVELGGRNAVAKEEGDGRYTLPLAQPLAAGVHTLNFTLQAGALADLLTTTLEVPALATAPPAGADRWALPGSPWQRAAAVGTAVTAAGLLGWGLRRRQPTAA